MQAMCCLLFPRNSACVNDINVGHIMPHQSPVKPKIHNPNPPVHPQLVLSPEEVDKSHICVIFPLCSVGDIFIYGIVLIYIQAVSRLSHDDNKILLGKAS